MEVFITASEQETMDLGYKIGQKANGGNIILMYGEMGMGKTVLARGIARGLGVCERVVSPTFTIMQVYQGRFAMYHFDLYRLCDPEELYDIGYEEFLYSQQGVSVVEWPERMGALCPDRHLRIEIQRLDEEHARKISIMQVGECLEGIS